ncbi:MAG: 4Fe-4S binding protein [Promethearchaeota archaeon]
MKITIDKNLCQNCNFCKVAIACPGEENCIACGSCVDACPYSARRLLINDNKRSTVIYTIDSKLMEVQSHQSVLQVLESLGFHITSYPQKNSN